MWLIVGLGNPGSKYQHTRHNMGFMLIDRLSALTGIKVGKSVCQSQVGVGRWLGREVVLAKPQTYMNLSGQAVKGLIGRYEVESDHLVVAHDELDLEPGRGKLSLGGGSAGHKGVASIISLLGRNDFIRLKLGVGKPDHPLHDAADYVLAPLRPEEREQADSLLQRAETALEDLLTNGLGQAQSRFNRTAVES